MEKFDEYNVNYEYICRFIRGAVKQNSDMLKELEAFAKQRGIPIAKPETMRFIEVLISGLRSRNILEIGAAIGYSAISMALCGGNVITIERDNQMVCMLKDNIKKASLSDKISVIAEDAATALPSIKQKFDFIFLDAAKGQYIDFLPDCVRLLEDGGMLFSDNVLYKGMVATDELVVRRKATIVRRLREYINMLCNCDSLITSVIPIGDGAAISCKKKIV